MKRGLVFLLTLFILINVNIALSFSSENIGNLSHSIQKSYGPSEYIKGWINISLEDESADSEFEGGKGNPIKLIDLLRLNNVIEHDTCTPRNCETDYSEIADSGTDEKSFSLDYNNYSIFGLKFTGELDRVNSIDFTLESDANHSCHNQLEIDFFNDGIIDIRNDKVKDDPDCSKFLKSYGCFNESGKNTEYFDIGTNYYCQRIKLSESPGFLLGAWVKNISNIGGKLTMSLHNTINGEEKGTCDLPMEDISEDGEEVFCNITYLVTESKDYYVCISSDNGGESYRIKGYYDPLNGCGFGGSNIPQSTTRYAYNISVEGKRFDAIKTLNIQNFLPNEGETLGKEVEIYLNELYYNREKRYIDCSTDCIVPIKFTSRIFEKTQTITIKKLWISYDRHEGGTSSGERSFYNISTTSATINADFQKLYLNKGNFSVPSKIGDYTFLLKLDDKKIFSEKVFVERVPVIENLKPQTTASAYPTEFEVIVDSEGNIIEYKWEFGNNDTKTTTTNKVTYTYNSTGTYDLRITVTDFSQRNSSKVFVITVGTPEEIINRLLTKMQKDLTNIKEQINDFSLFCQDSLKSILDLELFENELEKIQTDNASATIESDYNKIMPDLLELKEKIPESVFISTSADSISFYPKEENINLEILKEIGGGEYDEDKEDEYINATLAWNHKNIETKITFKELFAKYEYSEKPILKIFELKINKKNETYNPYLILRQLDNLTFKENYSEEEKDEYVYIYLTDSQTTITFSTTEDVSFIDLPVFISPAISELSIIEGPDEKDEALSKMALFILIIFLLAIIGVVVYIILQEWYKRKYENYLFKNRNELYNLISYIQSSKKKGLENKEIIIKLKKAGWKSEQITYVMRKYSGKRTGMFELPVGKILSRFKKEKVKNMAPGRLRGNFSRSKTFTHNFNSRRTRKRFS